MQRAGSVPTQKKEMYPLPRSEFNPLRWALNVPNMKPWLLVWLISGVKGSISFDIINCSSVVRKLLKSVFHPQHWARFFHQLYIPPMVVTSQGTCRDVHDSSHVGGITNSSAFWDVQMWQNRQNRLSLSALQDREGVLCHQTKHNREAEAARLKQKTVWGYGFVPSFRSSALPLTVLLLHYIGNGQSVHSIRSTSEGCANQGRHAIRWLSVMGQLFHSNHEKRTKYCTPVATNLSQPWLLQQTSGGCQQWQRLLYQQPTLRWGESTSQQPRKLDQIPSSKRSPWRSSLYRAAHLQNQQPTSDLMCQVLPLQTCATQSVMYQNCDCSWL